MNFLFEMIKILRVFLRENDNLFEMIFFAKTRFKMTRRVLSFRGGQEGQKSLVLSKGKSSLISK